MELTNILLGVCLTFILYNSFYKWIDKGWLPDTEPFNCGFCLSFWVFIGLFFVSLDPLTVAIPFVYRLAERILNRI